MNAFCTEIEMNKHLKEFIKTLSWTSYKYVFNEALKSISYNYNDLFSFEIINFEKLRRDPLDIINSFDLDFQFIIYFKIWIYQLGTAPIEYNS